MRLAVLLLTLLSASPGFAQDGRSQARAEATLEEQMLLSRKAQEAADERRLERGRRAMTSICMGCGLNSVPERSRAPPLNLDRLRSGIMSGR